MAKRYFQNGFRDFAGDIVMMQYTEVDLPSGLVVPELFATVTVEGRVSTAAMIAAMGTEFYDDTEAPHGVTLPERSENLCTDTRFSVAPHDAQQFFEISSRRIVAAITAMTYRGLVPEMDYSTVKAESDIPDEDMRLLNAIGQNVTDIVNEVDRSQPVRAGLYL